MSGTWGVLTAQAMQQRYGAFYNCSPGRSLDRSNVPEKFWPLMPVREIIKSGSTPFNAIEILTNSAEAKTNFEAMLKEMAVPGIVRFEP